MAIFHNITIRYYVWKTLPIHIITQLIKTGKIKKLCMRRGEEAERKGRVWQGGRSCNWRKEKKEEVNYEVNAKVQKEGLKNMEPGTKGRGIIIWHKGGWGVWHVFITDISSPLSPPLPPHTPSSSSSSTSYWLVSCGLPTPNQGCIFSSLNQCDSELRKEEESKTGGGGCL